MRLLICLFVLCPFILRAQESELRVVLNADSGIQWTKADDWNVVLKKSQEENKNIFVDFYATWCGPCKLMDKNIFSTNEVGELMNNKFISVKVQMDKTALDDELIKKWYNQASNLRKNI